MQAVGVLIFVDQHMVEAVADVVCQRLVAHGLRPVQQQVVIIEYVLRLLGFDIGREQLLQFGSPSGAPWKRRPQHLLDRDFRIDAARVDRKAGALGRKPFLGFGKSLLVPDQVHQVGGILAVVNGERGIETDLLGVLAQQPRADAVEGAGPGERVRHNRSIVAQHLARDPLDPLRHFGGRPPRECHQQDAPGVGAVDDQMRHAVCQRVGLAGSSAGDHQKRRAPARFGRAMLDGAPLFRIEVFEIGCG